MAATTAVQHNNDPGLINTLLDKAVATANRAEGESAREHAQEVRAKYPAATVEQLVDILTREKALRTATIGAVTSGASVMPGLGTLVSTTLGVAADAAMTLAAQAELVLEIAELHGRTLSPTEQRNAILLVTGASIGADRAFRAAGRKLATTATRRLSERAIAKAIPFVGIAASAGVNMLSTYVIGRRAHAYFSLGPEALGSLDQSLQAITGVDREKMTNWLADWAMMFVRGVGIGVVGAAQLVGSGAKGAARLVGGSAKSVAGAVGRRFRRNKGSSTVPEDASQNS